MNARRRTPTVAVLRRRRGFTLVELLTAIAIIAILISILVPVVIHARRAAAINRTKQDLEAIRTALDAYKADWGMYPPIAPLPNPVTASAINNGEGKPMLTYDGAHALFTALMLKGNARLSRTTNSSGAAVIGGGRTYGPYLNTEQLKSISDPTNPASTLVPAGQHCLLCDSYGNPILYVPAYPLPLNYTITALVKTPPNTYVDNSANPTTATGARPYYDFAAVPAQIPTPSDSASPTVVPFHNSNYSNNGLDEMRVMLGDADHNGYIDTTLSPPEQAAATGPYLLWTAGPDGRFGINKDSGKTDDICNFDLPAQLRE